MGDPGPQHAWAGCSCKALLKRCSLLHAGSPAEPDSAGCPPPVPALLKSCSLLHAGSPALPDSAGCPPPSAPCQLYTEEFYRSVVARKLAPDGIFVTQSGPAGVLSCGEVFTAIHRTIAAVFPRALPYTQHIPSYVDTWVRARRWQQCRTAQRREPFPAMRGTCALRTASRQGDEIAR